MKIEALNRPFDAALIRQRPGKGGQQLSYVEGGEYIRRLNEAFEHRWALKVLSHEITSEAAVVEVELEVPELGVVKHAFGGQALKGMDPWDALKAAETDALKKAASMLGIGIHLWCDDIIEEPAPPQVHQARNSPPAPHPSQAHAQRSAPPTTTATTATPTATPKAAEATQAHTAERVRSERQAAPATGGQRQAAPSARSVTEKQLNAIMAIGRSMGWSSEALRQHSIDAFGVPPNQLTSMQASEMITQLQTIAKKEP